MQQPQRIPATTEFYVPHIPTILSIRMNHHRLIQFQGDLCAVFDVKAFDPALFSQCEEREKEERFPFRDAGSAAEGMFPSYGVLSGAIGTPPPSARRFMAAAKIMFWQISVSPSTVTVARKVFMENKVCTVSIR